MLKTIMQSILPLKKKAIQRLPSAGNQKGVLRFFKGECLYATNTLDLQCVSCEVSEKV
jgi:hypothetical protein